MSRRNLDGILLLDKPKGITSNTALQIAKRLFKAKKGGHTGSLDPLASGLLPICFGEATKFSRFLLESDKHYETTAQLGIKTDSGDAEGNVLSERSVPPFTLAELEKHLDRFRGNICQIPSMFSAIKYQGQPLYKLARQGLVVDRESRPVFIESLKILEWQNNQYLSLEVRATKGTYIRSLVDDIGDALGCGAHVVELRRIGAGPYRAHQMVTFETLEAELETEGLDDTGINKFSSLDRYLLPVDTAVSVLPALTLSDSTAYYLKQGQAVFVSNAPAAGWVRLVLKNSQFLGVGEILEDGKVAPRRLIEVLPA